MSYTILAASYANAEHEAAILTTQEAGAVMASELDTPDLWSEMLASGVTVSPYVAPPPTIDDYRRAIQSEIDATAQTRHYDSGVTCSSYLGSTNPAWAGEAAAFVAWRDDVWTYTYAELAKVQAGERAQPDIAAFVAELPAMSWPAA